MTGTGSLRPERLNTLARGALGSVILSAMLWLLAALPAEGTQSKPAEPPASTSTSPSRNWAEVFLHGFGNTKPGAAESAAWLAYRNRVHDEHEVAELLSHDLSPLVFAPVSLTFHQFVLRLADLPARPASPAAAASSIIALRAAWRAVAATNDPDAFYAVYEALSAPDLPLTPTERILAQATALRQCISRFPPPELYKRGSYRARPQIVAATLGMVYAGDPDAVRSGKSLGLLLSLPAVSILAESDLCDGTMAAVLRNGAVAYVPWKDRDRFQLIGGPLLPAPDLAHDMAVLAGKYAAIELDPKTDAQTLKALSELLKTVNASFEKVKKEYDKAIELGLFGELRDRVKFALGQHLVGEALKLLTDKGTDLAKAYGKDHIEALLVRAALQQATGRIEEVSAGVKAVPALLAAAPFPPEVREYKQAQYQSLLFQKRFFEGDFKGAGELYEQLLSGRFRAEPTATLDEAIFDPAFVVALGSAERAVQILHLAPVSPLGRVSREMLLSQLLVPYYQRQHKLGTFRIYAAEYASQRGLLALLEGDAATARKWFEQARKSAVPEWGIPTYVNPTAEFYLLVFKAADEAAGIR